MANYDCGHETPSLDQKRLLVMILDFILEIVMMRHTAQNCISLCLTWDSDAASIDHIGVIVLTLLFFIRSFNITNFL